MKKPAFFLMLILVLFFCGEARALTFTVNSTADKVDLNLLDGKCSAGFTPLFVDICTLRAAIMEANALAGGSHTINVPAGTYTLSILGADEDFGSTGDLDINNSNSITINGAGPDKTIIAGGGIDRVFDIHAGTTTIRGVTIRNGSTTGSGGAVRAANSIVTLSDCLITGNTAQLGSAIQNMATLSVRGCSIYGNNVTFASKSVGNQGTLTLENVSIVEDTPTLINNGGTTALRNVSITTRRNYTTIENTGGIVTVKNSAFKHRPTGGATCAGAITSEGHNVEFWDDTCGFRAPGDIYNGEGDFIWSASVRPVLALHEMSNGIDAGDGCLSTDQTGARRPLDGNGDRDPVCDIGAYEFRKDKVGVFRLGQWPLDYNGNRAWNPPPADSLFTFGLPGDVPVTGTWAPGLSGQRKAKLGVFRNGMWALDSTGDSVWDGCGVTPDKDRCYTFGLPTDKPVTGDWDGDGATEIGVFRDGTWVLDWNGNGSWDGPSTDRVFTFGLPGDKPVTGDWSGDGRTKIGVFRAGKWYLDYNGNGAWDPGVDKFYAFGLPTDVPVTGDWNGDTLPEIGVYRNGIWFLDMNGNGIWEGSVIDKQFTFGLATDKPVTGFW